MTKCIEDKRKRPYSRKFPYVFEIRNFDKHELIGWLNENVGKSAKDYLIWGVLRPGSKYGIVYIKREMDAMAFKLAWV